MKIGKFEVGEHYIKEEGGKRHLIFNYENSPYNASIADEKATRYHVLSVLQDVEVDKIVLFDKYERIYTEEQTQMLIEISNLIRKFSNSEINSQEFIGDPKIDEENVLSDRFALVTRITKELIKYDPISAYLTLMQELQKEKRRIEALQKSGEKFSDIYYKNLLYIKEEFEKTKLIQLTKKYLSQLTQMPDVNQLYKVFFEAELKPAIIGATLLGRGEEKLELLDEYEVKGATIQIFSHPNQLEKIYYVNAPEYSFSPEKYFIWSKAKERVANYRPGKTSLATNRKYFERIYEGVIASIAKERNRKLSQAEIKELAQIVARYTVGYGILEILLSDREEMREEDVVENVIGDKISQEEKELLTKMKRKGVVTDIYLDAPIGQKPIYLVHSQYGECKTNILYSESDAESLVSKIRAQSERPFDETHPVLDYDMPDYDTRVAIIGPPLSPDGVAFAFRLHRMAPWTFAKYVDPEIKMMNKTAAGLLSFLISAQATILVCGSRGAGKTSLLGGMLLELPESTRILIQEDTLELGAEYMKEIGFNVQRLKTRSPISVSTTESEVAPEESLRTALRLGDSALVLGEVRSQEAKVLYEAMRVGAAGSSVMGTIHADSAYAVWDRVVNDLGVPTTSFKATDLVVVARPIRKAGSLRSVRRVYQITEVGKHWLKEPEKENGLIDLMTYDAKKDELILNEENLKKSELIKKTMNITGLTYEEILKEIELRGESKTYLAELKNKHSVPQLLEAEYTTPAANKLLLLREKYIQEKGEIDYEKLLEDWKKWVQNNLLKKVLEEKVINK